MVAGDLGDHLDLVVGEAGQLGVADHVVGVEVVLAVGDDETDVGEQRPGLEVLAGSGTEAGRSGTRVEQGDGEAGDVDRVGRIVVAALDELMDAAPRHVAEVVDLGAATSPADRVEQHPLAECRLGEHERGHSNVSAIVATMSAPATMMSARWASSPGTFVRAEAVRCLTSRATTSSSALGGLTSKQLYVRSGSAPVRAWAMRATVSAVPDEATATSNP